MIVNIIIIIFKIIVNNVQQEVQAQCMCTVYMVNKVQQEVQVQCMCTMYNVEQEE